MSQKKLEDVDKAIDDFKQKIKECLSEKKESTLAPAVPTRPNHCAVEEKARVLFHKYGSFPQKGGKYRAKKTPAIQCKSCFMMILLLRSPNEENTVPKCDRKLYEDHGLLQVGIKFENTMTESEILLVVKKSFKPLLDNIVFDFMLEINTQDLTPIPNTSPMDGIKFFSMYKAKTIFYIRPRTELKIEFPSEYSNSRKRKRTEVDEVIDYDLPSCSSSSPRYPRRTFAEKMDAFEAEDQAELTKSNLEVPTEDDVEDFDDPAYKAAIEASLREIEASNDVQVELTKSNHEVPTEDDVEDFDDPAYKAAIEASLRVIEASNDVNTAGDCRDSKSFVSSFTGTTVLDVLKHIRDTKLQETNEKVLYIQRSAILQSAFRAMERSWFDPTKKIFIVFTEDLTGIDREEGVDSGGLRREFLSLALKNLQSSSMFVGPTDHKYLAYDAKYVDNRSYFHAGVILGKSLLEGGPTPSMFHCNFFHLLLRKFDDIEEDVNCLPPAVRDLVQNIRQAESDSVLADIIPELMLQTCGIRYVLSTSCKDRIISDVMQYYLHGCLHTPLRQLQEGLSVNGVLDFIIAKPELFKDVFTINKVVDSSVITNLFRIDRSEDKDSRSYTLEGRTLGFWTCLLEDCEEGKTEATCSDILQFATGASNVPLLGFDFQPKLKCFTDPETKHKTLPEANTCSLTLTLPTVHEQYESFLEKCDMVFKYCKEFNVI